MPSSIGLIQLHTFAPDTLPRVCRSCSAKPALTNDPAANPAMSSPRGRAGECKAKGCIYAENDERPLTPAHLGKKMVPGAGGDGAKPFATGSTPFAEGDGRYPLDFHMLGKPGSIMGKVGTQEISNDYYREQSELRHAVDVESRARNSGGPTPYASDSTEPFGGGAPARAAGAHPSHPEPTCKIGAAGGFDADVYARQRAANQEVQQQSRTKKFGAGADASHGAPFATSDSYDELRRRDYYHAKPRREDGSAAGKPYSQQSFDPAPYNEQIRRNQSLAVEGTHKSFVGSGDILAHGE
ncbi:MAG: hypothetical protein J3K34DRAFT_3166 [Monoraphidium minutum]|nr:MAG: hypothetical protein J3K34DRAFT_3166 [Monoraphidium minutum]